VGSKLKELRKANKLTQKDFAEELGIAQTTYAGYETGRHEPDLSTLLKMSRVLKVSINYLINRF
jgi:transcriptional regulator with XRE-family HTH domain